MAESIRRRARLGHCARLDDPAIAHSLVRPLCMVMDQVLPHHMIKVPPAQAYEVVQALLLERLHHPLGVGVHVG